MQQMHRIQNTRIHGVGKKFSKQTLLSSVNLKTQKLGMGAKVQGATVQVVQCASQNLKTLGL
jgi:hypothetical protein